MDEKSVSVPSMVTSEDNIDGFYPIFFGVSCAFFALKLIPKPDEKWSETRNSMLKGSANLLSWLIWKAQRQKMEKNEKLELLHKLENAQEQISQLNKTRSEDAKANAKVVSIFAAREQSWFHERKNLRQEIGSLMNDLRVLEIKKEKSISELDEKLNQTEAILKSKDEMIEEGARKGFEAEKMLKKAENLVEEMRQKAEIESQSHASEILKHKTAFLELVSIQRQLEGEMGRALRQVELGKKEVDSVLEQREKLVLVNQRLSIELVRVYKDLEQKDQILSAMLMKSKLDTEEKQELLKEVKSSRVKREKAEMETARWRAVLESKQEKYSLRNMLSNKHVNGNLVEQKKMEIRKGLEVFGVLSDPYSTEDSQSTADNKELESWITSEAEKYKIAIKERHQLTIDAFVDQLRLKDETIESFRWRLMNTELESKRLRSHIKGLDHDIRQLKKDKMKLESTLVDRDAELNLVKEQLILHSSPPNPPKSNFESCRRDTVWSNVEIIRRKPGHRRQQTKEIYEEFFPAEENVKVDMKTSDTEKLQDIVFTIQSPKKEIKEGEFSLLGQNHFIGQGSSERSNSKWKMDIHALGVSYKVKRLKQQLIMLETGKKENCENGKNKDGVKGLYSLLSLIKKQVDRCQSLQGKIDDLCMRMHEKNMNLKYGDSTIDRPVEDQTKRLGQFLEETFQLQRYVVATGQKIMEVQAKIASGFAEEIETPTGFDVKRFADSIKALFQEVQRGLEVRVSRIIGDLEGTLACDGFNTSQK